MAHLLHAEDLIIFKYKLFDILALQMNPEDQFINPFVICLHLSFLLNVVKEDASSCNKEKVALGVVKRLDQFTHRSMLS